MERFTQGGESAADRALLAACARGDVPSMRAALEDGANLNLVVEDRLHPPLVVAQVLLGRAEIVRELLALGADVEARDGEGCTALLRAAQFSHGDKAFNLISDLVKAGADVNADGVHGKRPLDYAAAPPAEARTVGLLVAHGAVGASRGTALRVVRLLDQGSRGR